jgi:hypothetical protein
LKALLTVAKAQFDKDTKDPKTLKAQKDLEKSLSNLAKQTQTYSRTVSTLTSEKENYTRSIRDSRKANQQQTLSVKNVAVGAAVLAKAVVNVTSKFVTLISDISDVGDSLTSAAGLIRALPLGSVSDKIASAAQALASATEKTQKSFIDAASVGANFKGNMEEMINSASAAGLTVDQFSGIISRNGEALALLSATTADGARRFAQLGKAMRNSDVQNQLANLGFNTQEINEGMLRYSNLLAKAGTDVRNMVPEELVALTGHYYRNLSAVSQLTGESRKALEDEAIARQRDSRSRILESRLDDTSRETYRAMILSVAQEHRGAAEEIILGMGLQSDGAKAFAALAPDAARAFDELGRNITRTGELSESTASSVYDVYSDQARRLNLDKDFQALLGGPLQESYGQFVVGMMNVAARGDSALDEAFAEVSETAAKRGRELGEIDPSDILKAQQQVAEMSNTALRFLAKQTDLLTATMGYLASKVTSVISTLDGVSDWARKTFRDDRTEIEKERDKIQQALTRASQSVEFGEGPRDEVKEKELADQLRVLNAQVANQSVTLSPEEQHRQEETARQRGELAEKQEKLDKEIQETLRRQTEATETNTQATQNLTRETKKASSCELDYSSPQALFNSFAKIMVGGRPGVTDRISGASVATITGEDEMFSAVGPANLQHYLKTVAMLESSGNPLARAGTSSASGLFQFTEGTWKNAVAQMGKDYTLEDRFDPKKAAEVMAFFTQQQKTQLEESIGREASDLDLYMAHFLGAGGASKFLKGMSTDPTASAADLVGSQAAQANRSIFFKDTEGTQARSLQEVYALMGRKFQRQEANVLSGNVPSIVAELGNMSQSFAPSSAQASEAMTPDAQGTGGGNTPTPPGAPGAPAASNATNATSSQLESLNTSMGQVAVSTREMVEQNRKIIIALKELSDNVG